MVQVQYNFEIDGSISDDPFLDRTEIAIMFEQTKQSMGKAVARQLEGITCDEHGAEPIITISGRFDAEREEMDIQYNIDTCCKRFLKQVIHRLNNT